MISHHVLDLRLLAGVLASLFAATVAQARQIELLQFWAAVDGIVIDVGGNPTRAPKVPAVSDEAPVDLDGLRQDFAAMVPPASSRPSAITERSGISVPLWMQPGHTSTSTFRSMALLAANGFRTPTCSLSPYRPRGDLSVFVEQRRANFYPLIRAVACEAGVPAGLLDALIAQESRYDPATVSAKGAVGLTQLMPGTAAYLGVVDARDPLQNLRGGARYLRAHFDEIWRVDLALAAYNAGPGRVRTRGRIPPFAETIGYVAAVLRG